MSASFFFYDLETSGISAARDRIMQFGGQRTDLDLNPIGEALNIAIKLAEDILPNPEAILVSGISPSENNKNGISEAEFADIFNDQIARPGTIFVGFNNIRFDDEFIRYSNYRNFYDAYSWHWKDDSSRWDILDVVRMTRALRPEGINWPTKEGKPSNKLELLTNENKLDHFNAHDALSDALATIEIARLLKTKQPKIFNYLLSIRKKPKLIELIKDNEMLVYTSSHYSSEVLHTSVVSCLNLDEKMGLIQVYDLRIDPKQFLDLPVEELTKLWEYNPEQLRPILPVKTVRLNRCPAIAPISVLDQDSIKRIDIDLRKVRNNLKTLQQNKEQFADKLKLVTKQLDKKQDERFKGSRGIAYPDERLYEKFIPPSDASLFTRARLSAKAASPSPKFSDKRLNELFELYKARNYPKLLSQAEEHAWQEHVIRKLFEGQESNYQRIKDQVESLIKENIANKDRLELLKDIDNYIEEIKTSYAN
jgi:exodeoxyribonuclease-1